MSLGAALARLHELLDGQALTPERALMASLLALVEQALVQARASNDPHALALIDEIVGNLELAAAGLEKDRRSSDITVN